MGKIDRHQELPIHQDGMTNPRLKSRMPFLQTALAITKARETIPGERQAAWLRKSSGDIRVDNVRTPVVGMDLPKKTRVTLNRIPASVEATHHFELPTKEIRRRFGGHHQSRPRGNGLVGFSGRSYAI